MQSVTTGLDLDYRTIHLTGEGPTDGAVEVSQGEAGMAAVTTASSTDTAAAGAGADATTTDGTGRKKKKKRRDKKREHGGKHPSRDKRL